MGPLALRSNLPITSGFTHHPLHISLLWLCHQKCASVELEVKEKKNPYSLWCTLIFVQRDSDSQRRLRGVSSSAFLPVTRHCPLGTCWLSWQDIVTLTANSKQCICIMLQLDSSRMLRRGATLTGLLGDSWRWVELIGDWLLQVLPAARLQRSSWFIKTQTGECLHVLATLWEKKRHTTLQAAAVGCFWLCDGAA